MTLFLRSRSVQALLACVLVISITSVGRSQALIAPGQWPWPAACYPGTTWDGFHLLCDTSGPVCPINDAAMRITLGSACVEPIFAQLGVVDSIRAFGGTLWHPWFSAIAPIHATVLRSSWGDLVLSATTCLPSPTHAGAPPHASIHFGTTPSPPAVDTTVEQPWDMERMTLWWDGKAAIGTQGIIPAAIMGDSGHIGEYDLLHLHVPCIPLSYNVDTTAGYAVNQLMAMKLSYGGIGDGQLRFAELGFDRGHQLSSFSSDQDLVLSTNFDQAFGPAGSGLGDIIFSNRRIGKALRFGTTYDTGETPSTITDAEHLAILSSGNVGIDMPDSATGLMKPLDQVQIGGGMVAPTGDLAPLPGLTLYGGNRFENTLLPNGKKAPTDWRYIGFNYATKHLTSDSNRNFRIAPLSSSAIKFSETNGGTILLNAWPYDSTKGKTSIARGMYMGLYGSGGIDIWSDESDSDQYHHLFDIWRPHYMGWDSLRNDSGLAMFHVPVYIGGGPTWYTPNFTDLHAIDPDMGDFHTWTLAVNGPVLVRDLFVLDSNWADYVFDPDYHLRPLIELENYIQENHHLPDIPSAAQITKAGIPVARTEAILTKKVEELTLYTIQLSKQNEELSSKLDTLEKKLEVLENQKGE